MYERTEAGESKDALAATLSALATRRDLPELCRLLADPKYGVSRIMFFRALTRLRAPDRWEVIQRSVDDPDLRREAAYLLHQRELREARKSR
jgi:hypothetical protein